MKTTNQAQENWLVDNQRSIRNLDKVAKEGNKQSQSAIVKQTRVPASDSIRKRLQFMKQFAVPSLQSNSSNENNNPAANTLTTLHEQQQTGIGLDNITKMLFETMQELPTDVQYVKATDLNKNEVRMQGVRMLTSNFSSYRNLSREVRLCTNIEHSTSMADLKEIKDCCNVIFSQAVFPNTPTTNYTINKTNTVKSVNKVDVMNVCQSMPVCYSPSFQMTQSTTEKLSKAITFAENTKGLKVFEVLASPTSMYQDSIILTPRHVGGNLLYTTSLFTDMDDLDQKDTHLLQSMSTKKKHPRFGISLAHHMDHVVAQVHDTAQTNVKSWMRSICNKDTDMYNTISANNHSPTFKLSNTEHCAYLSPCQGTTVLVQNNQFSVSAPTLIRYGLDKKPQSTLNICAVSIIFHGPTIHKV